MADVKVSGLPTDSSLDGNHYVVLNDPSGPTTKRGLLSVLATFFFNQVNIPSGSGSPVTRLSDSFYDHVVPNTGIWSGDAYASTRNASMGAMTIYINGRRILINGVTARSFTASRDTYVDVLDNQDGTGTLVYTEVTNNAASPALAANSVRVAIIVTGASNIANAGSVNQGQEDKVLPIASSIPYAVTDSLGNLICPRDPLRRVIGYRQITSNFATTGSADMTGLNLVFQPTATVRYKVTGYVGVASTSVANNGAAMTINDVTAGANICTSNGSTNASADSDSCQPTAIKTWASGARNIKAVFAKGTNAATANSNGSATNPNFILIERA